jgi:hypothetical protein
MGQGYSSANNSLLLFSNHTGLVFDDFKITIDFTHQKSKGGYEIWCEIMNGSNFKKDL